MWRTGQQAKRPPAGACCVSFRQRPCSWKDASLADGTTGGDVSDGERCPFSRARRVPSGQGTLLPPRSVHVSGWRKPCQRNGTGYVGGLMSPVQLVLPSLARCSRFHAPFCRGSERERALRNPFGEEKFHWCRPRPSPQWVGPQRRLPVERVPGVLDGLRGPGRSTREGVVRCRFDIPGNGHVLPGQVTLRDGVEIVQIRSTRVFWSGVHRRSANGYCFALR